MKTVASVACILAAAAAAVTSAGCGSHHDAGGRGLGLRAMPTGLRWEDFRGVAMPLGDAGPHQLTDTATGYDRTPQGAALAAIDHAIHLGMAGDDTWADVEAVEVAPGPGKDSFAVHRLMYRVTSEASPATRPTVRGYTITAYSPDRASVLVFESFPDRSIATTAETVAWVAGDWRLLLPDSDSTIPTVRSVGAMNAAVPLEAGR